MIDSFVRETLLEPGSITEQELGSVLGAAFGRGTDGGDCYFQFSCQEGWSLEDGLVKSASFNIERGVGIRVISGEQTGFAYSDEITMPAMLEAARTARSIASAGQTGSVAVRRGLARESALYLPDDPLGSMGEARKIELLKHVDAEARAADPRVTQVICSLAGSREVVLILNAEGELVTDVRPLVRMNVQVLVEQGGRRESGSAGGGGRSGYAHFTEDDRAGAFAREAVRQALVNLEAVDAPAGTMKVVLGPGWPGVLLHEAIGHGLEGDFNRKGTSAFAGRIGERVAAPGITIVDDGTLPGRRGSLNVDDEGTVTQQTVLIEDGYLRGYMQDRLNGRLSGTRSTGNGRRESYAHSADAAHDQHLHARGRPRPGRDHRVGGSRSVCGQLRRRAGGHHLRQVRVLGLGGLSDRGRAGHPPGEGGYPDRQRPGRAHPCPMVGNDLKLDAGVGTCGKDGQGVPVGVGQPTLRIDGMTVGGTQAA
jgi:TldD protein